MHLESTIYLLMWKSLVSLSNAWHCSSKKHKLSQACIPGRIESEEENAKSKMSSFNFIFQPMRLEMDSRSRNR